MNQKLFRPLVIWFAVFFGFFVLIEFVGGGLSVLNADFEFRSRPLMFLGFVPLAVAVFSRFLIIPRIINYQIFLSVFTVALALCEGSGLVAMFVFPAEMAGEKSFVLIGSIIGLAILCPFGMSQLAE